MVRTYSETEIIDNVTEISAAPRGATLAYLNSPTDDFYDTQHRSVSNSEGVTIEIHPQTHMFQEIEMKVDASGTPGTYINSRHAPMTCVIARPNKQYDNRKTVVNCSPNTKEFDLESVLTGMKGLKGIFDGMGLDTEEKGIRNLYDDLGIDETEPLYQRHRLVQLASPEEQEKNRTHYTRRFFVEDEIRSRLSAAVTSAIEKEARHNVDDMPPIVYRKVNTRYLLDCLYHGGCVNSSGPNSWSRYQQLGEPVREDPRNPPELSFSEEYLDRCDLATPAERQEVTMVMRIPKTACPLRVKYAERSEDLYDTDEGYLYPIAVRKHIEEVCPACDCIDEMYVKNVGQTAAWKSERELVVTECNSGRVRFEPDDVVHLVVETQCGVDFEKVKEEVSLVAPDYADRVISFEEWTEKYAKREQ